MKAVTVMVSDSFIRLLHANAQLHAEDNALDVAGVLARVFSQAGMGIHPDVIYLSIPHEWRDDIDAAEQAEEGGSDAE